MCVPRPAEYLGLTVFVSTVLRDPGGTFRCSPVSETSYSNDTFNHRSWDPIGARIPRPVVEGVVGPIPMGGEELQLVRRDLESGGHRVAGVTRLNNRKNEPSMAVKISLEATELPEEVWLGSTPYCVQAYAATVHQVPDAWAHQATVPVPTEPLLQMRQKHPHA